MRNGVRFVRIILELGLLLGVATLMWRVGAPLPVAGTWFALMLVAAAIDPALRGRFFAGLVVATIVAGIWSGIDAVAKIPNQVARMLLFEFLPTAPTVTRPLVVTLGLWSIAGAIVFALLKLIRTARWRQALLHFAGIAVVFAGFCYAMLFAWPDPALTKQQPPPPLGVSKIYFHEHFPADLSEVVNVPVRPPVPQFTIRRGLSYGPHSYRNTLDLYKPEGADGPVPVVIYIHGGGAGDGGTHADQNDGLPDVWRDPLLARGFAIANINYRLVFADANSPHDEVTGPFPAQIQDCLAVVRYLRAEAEELGVDPDRIAAMGHSFGGCLASLAGLAWDCEEFQTDTRRGVSSQVQAVVNLAGLTDLRIIGNQTRYWAKVWNLPVADYINANDFGRMYCQLGDLGSEFDPNAPVLARASPIAYVRKDASPFLIMYGFRDLAAQGEMLHMDLKQVGASSRLIIIPGAGHGLAGVSGTGDVVAEFLQERLTGGS